ncbi:hypothetical protein G7Y89_g6954 [Cudoniella acicularis]|uniref:Ubiquitin-like domain-containing protein n=1 Tax=Cudoniella acicularis TaxID=354080 RepID=A0A8H4RLQ2_9HELO|nr:hypothetical protein G7Y89_g6954 [Cudoniella acicularis]
MADPFSIISLVNATLKGVILAKDFVASIQRAPRSIETLSDDLSALEGMLRHLGYLVDKSDDESHMNRIIRDPLANCEKISRQVGKLVRPYVKSSKGVTLWGRFAFGFKESEVQKLQTEMSACKQTLTIAIASADYLTGKKTARGVRRIQNHFGIESSSVAESDIGDRGYQRITEWNSKTETIFEEQIPDTPRKSIQTTMAPKQVEGSSYTFIGSTFQSQPETTVLQSFNTSSKKGKTKSTKNMGGQELELDKYWINIKEISAKGVRRYPVSVHSGLSIWTVKYRIYLDGKYKDGKGILTEYQQLRFKDIVLENVRTLADYNVQGGDELTLYKLEAANTRKKEKPSTSIMGEDLLHLWIIVPNHEDKAFTFSASDTIKAVKQKVNDIYEIPTHQQTATVDGRRLEDDKTLSDYNLRFRDTIYISTMSSC